MRETKFIEQNKDKWTEFEKVLEKEADSPEKLNELFIQVTDDLSYARTFYPNRSVRVYLNSLAQKVFFNLYKKRKQRKGRVMHFIKEDLPQLIYESRQEFRVSLLIFVLSMAIGVLSCYMDEDFVQIVLGQSYIDMTLENIENGDPMAVYKAQNESGMFAHITANNLRVALMTFAMGALYAIGTVLILIKNGIMVGAFQYFFVEQDLFWESFLTIWTHGTLEISAIIISGAAGLTMGRGLVFPGTFSRIKAFQLSARRGLKIMIGITPVIILAGFIEGFFTRYTETPDIIRLGFILACLAFILFYFVYYPWAKAKRGFQSNLRQSHLSPEHRQDIDFESIKSSGAIFSDVFVFVNKHLSQIVKYAAFATFIFVFLTFSMSLKRPSETFDFVNIMSTTEPGIIQAVMLVAQLFLGALSYAYQFFTNENIPFLVVVNTLTVSLLATWVYSVLIKEVTHKNFEQDKKFIASSFISIFSRMLMPSAILAFFLSIGTTSIYLLSMLVLPFLMLWMYVMIYENKHVFEGIGRTFVLIKGSFGQIIGLGITLILLGMMTFMLSDSLVFYFIFDFIGMNLQFDDETMNNIATIFLTGIAMFFAHLIFAVLMIGFGITYHTLIEIKEAPNITKRIDTIGEERRLQGMAREG